MRYRLRFFSLALVLLFLAQPSFGQEKPQLVVQDGHGGTIVDLNFRAAGSEAVTASEDGTVKVWDLGEGRVLRTIYDKSSYAAHDYKPKIEHASYFPDKDQIFTVSGKNLNLFDVDTGKLVKQIEVAGYDGALEQLGEHFYVIADDVVTKLDHDGKILAQSAKLDRFNSYKVKTLSAGGNVVAVMDDNSIYILSPVDLSVQKKFPRDSAGRLAISADGTKLALSATKWLKVLNVSDGSTLATANDEQLGATYGGLAYYRPHWVNGIPYWSRIANVREKVPGVFKGLDFTPMSDDTFEHGYHMAGNSQGEILFSKLNGDFYLLKSDGTVVPYQGGTAGTTAFKLSLENKLLATGSNTGTVKLWDLKTGKLSRTFDGLTAYVGTLDISPNGKRIVAGDLYRGQILTWDVETGKQLSEVKVEAGRFGEGANKLTFLDNNSYLLTRTENGRVSVYNADTGAEEDYRDFGKTGMKLSAVHPNGRRITVVDRKGIITEFGLDSKRDRLSIEIPGGPGGYLTYSHDRKSLLVSSRHGNIYRWNYDDPENKLEKVASPWNRTEPIYFIEDNDKITAVTGQGRVLHYFKNGKIETATPLAKNYISRPQKVDEDLFLFNSTGDALVLANLSSGEYLGELVEFEAGKGWAVFTKDGQFDGNDFGLKKLDFELDGTVYRLSQFFNDYYTPGLAAKLFAVKKDNAVEPEDTRALTASTLKKPPKVDVTSPKSGTVLEQADFEVTVSVTDRGAGTSKVGLYHNGHRLPDRAMTKVDDTTYKFKVKAVQGVNDIRATAFDGSGSVEARRDRLRVVAPKLEARKPRLHLLAVGVDEYKSGLSLKYADDDATSVSSLFTSDIYETGERVLLTNKEATLNNILGKVSSLAEIAEPQDALVVYLAGHGTVLGETYYFLPHDADVASDQKLATTALSSDLLAQRLSEVPATKQLLVLDSCRSGAAAGVLGKYVAARSGLEEIRSQQMLARTSGTFLIAATQAEDYAYEIPELGHGVLTYSILNSLGKTGETSDKVTTANGLLRNVSSLVPELTQKYHGTTQQVVQYSSGQDFPLAR